MAEPNENKEQDLFQQTFGDLFNDDTTKTNTNNTNNNNKPDQTFDSFFDEKDKDMIADDDEKKSNIMNTNPSLNKCICGSNLIVKEAQNCYDESKAIECDSCGKTVKGNTKVYHCKNKQTKKHSEGYDLCKKCAVPLTVANTDGFDSFIFETLNKQNKNQTNLILSPFSILIAMTVCMLGADKNTLNEMLNVLYCNRSDKSLTFMNSKKITKQILKLCKYFNKEYNGKNGRPIVKIANKIWIQNGYKIFKKYIDASGVDCIGSMDNNASKTAEIINQWCCDNTNKMIRKVVQPNDVQGAQLVIANAIYFKGKFIRAFAKKNTEKNVSFYVNKNRKKVISTKIKMMHSAKNQFFIQKYKKYYDVVKLEYKESNLSLILAINNYSMRQKALLTTKDICKLKNKWKNQKLRLYVPKFKFEYEIHLGQTLQKMGMVDAFSDNANFSNMTETNDLCIGCVIHKAVIEVNETGTEAAAVTVVTMKRKGRAMRTKEPPPEIHFDHPFNFYIFDEQKETVLFSGAFVGKN